MRWLDGITDPMDMRLSRLLELMIDRKACYASFHGVAKVRNDRESELYSNIELPIFVHANIVMLVLLHDIFNFFIYLFILTYFIYFIHTMKIWKLFF